MKFDKYFFKSHAITCVVIILSIGFVCLIITYPVILLVCLGLLIVYLAVLAAIYLYKEIHTSIHEKIQDWQWKYNQYKDRKAFKKKQKERKLQEHNNLENLTL